MKASAKTSSGVSVNPFSFDCVNKYNKSILSLLFTPLFLFNGEYHMGITLKRLLVTD